MEISLETRVLREDVPSLIDDALAGNAAAVSMRVRQIANKLSKEDPKLAKVLYSKVSKDGSLRSLFSGASSLPAPVDSDSRQKLLIETYPVIIEREPVWEHSLEEPLRFFIEERHRADELLDAGLMPSRSLLMGGPPGVGKTLAAKWIANRLNLPLLTLDLATVMSSFLGKTGSNIRSVLEYACSFPCVLLLDEFDAIAKKRNDDSDVGELKRLVTVLLQAIDEWPASSVLIAATNHGELLDPAIWRRFDQTLTFQLPTREGVTAFLQSLGVENHLIPWAIKSFEGLSFAVIEKKIAGIKKRSILQKRSFSEVFFESVDVIGSNVDSNEGSKEQLIVKLAADGLSQRKISESLGVSRPKIKKVIEEFDQRKGCNGNKKPAARSR